MENNKYDSIENYYNIKKVTKLLSSNIVNNDWIVMEKIDGSNFSIYYDGNKISYATRNKMLDKTESFSNYQYVTAKYKEDIIKLFEFCKEKDKNFDYMIVYGELFGGYYNHPNVQKIKNMTKIIGRVSYTQYNDFIYYDIKLIKNNRIINKWVSYDDILSFKLPNLKCMKVLYRSKLTDFIELDLDNNIKPKLPLEFDSTIYKLYNLPKITNNIAEGYVIKSVNENYCEPFSRAILKIKNEKFLETSKNIYSNIDISQYTDVINYVTKSRLISVLSKLSDNDKKNNKIIIQIFTNDCINDFIKDKDIKLGKKELNVLKKIIIKSCVMMVLKNK